MDENTNRAEALRLLGIADKLLQGRDLSGSRDFAILAQETEPLLDGSDQILAVVDVLLASERRINNHHDWYAILQVERRSGDLEVIKKQYRRLALLLHPDKNKFAFADAAFKLVADAWTVLSDSVKKTLYDNELSVFSKIDLVSLKNQRSHHQQFRQKQEQHEQNQQKLPVRRNFGAANSSGKRRSDETRPATFWTACPYCYNLYEYSRVYEGCCLRCQNCERAIHGVQIQSLPPMVPGKEAYYCYWALFPLGFEIANCEGGKNTGFASWMPPMFPTAGTGVPNDGGSDSRDDFVDLSEGNLSCAQPGAKKRGRPKKNLHV